MTKTITKYSINMLASLNTGLQAQILFANDSTNFVGRIDFYKGGTLPNPYLWHPNNANDENQTYLVLTMWDDKLTNIVDLLRNEGPWSIELWPVTPAPFSGATTQGHAGVLKSTTERVGDGDFDFRQLHP